ncbi:MAG: LrgB family protein [Butyrivibrio sp.]|nr:LrgB family protein [Butyrivibrio sp.]
MLDFLTNATFFGAVASIVFYEAGLLIKKKCKLAIFNPLLISIIFTTLLLIVCKIDYDVYYEGAKYISYFLTPATVCLAIPLYEQFELLKKNVTAIMAGIMAGVISSVLTVLCVSVLFGFSHEEYVSFLPKSVTTAIGMGITEQLGGYVSITVAVIILTGVFGNVIGEAVCKIFRITEPVAKGVALGSSSHAIGTVKAMEMGEVEGAMSSLSIAVSGLITVIFAAVFSYLY